MTTFAFGENVTEEMKDTVSAALGTAAAQGIGNADVDKAVKMGTLQNYQFCADGDPIEGFINLVEAFTVNQGFAFGSVQRDGRKTVQNGAGQVQLAVGDYVVSFTQLAIGTAGLAQVKKAPTTAVVTSGTPSTVAIQSDYIWRVIRIVTGTGVAGDQVLIERV